MKSYWLLSLLLLPGCAGSCNPGDSVRTGQIIALTHEGYWNKTWEAELMKGGLSAGSGGTGVTPYWFTVENDSLLKLVKQAADSMYEVRVTYHTLATCSLMRSASGCDFLTSIVKERP